MDYYSGGAEILELADTFASQLVMKSVDLSTVRNLMGYADYQMTSRDAHLAPEYEADIVARRSHKLQSPIGV